MYTNHCVRGTTASAMKRAGYTLNEIVFILKHKNLESLKFNLEKPTLEDKSNFSKSLYDQTGEGENSDSDFKEPPRPCRSIVIPIKKKKNKPTSTVSKRPEDKTDAHEPIETNDKENLQLDVVSDNTNSNIQVGTGDGSKNILQIFKQNPIGMFLGANLTNCTININMPK